MAAAGASTHRRPINLDFGILRARLKRRFINEQGSARGRPNVDLSLRGRAAARDHAAHEPLVGSRWPACQRDRVAGGGHLRRRSLRFPQRGAESARHVPLRPGRARRGAGRPQPGAQPRARAGAPARAPDPCPGGAAGAPQDQADGRLQGSPRRGQAAPVAAQAGAPAPGRRRQPRPDPRARRAREQPQGRQRRDPEAPADGVHRRLRLGQELAGVRHDRRGVAAADQRDLQRLRAGLHADAGPARRRRARRADDGDHRRPGADGRQRPLHGRHRHRRQRDAAHPLQPARAAAHRLAPGVLVQRRLDHGRGGGHRRARRQDHHQGAAQLQPSPAACARAARAGARSPTST